MCKCFLSAFHRRVTIYYFILNGSIFRCILFYWATAIAIDIALVRHSIRCSAVVRLLGQFEGGHFYLLPMITHKNNSLFISSSLLFFHFQLLKKSTLLFPSRSLERRLFACVCFLFRTGQHLENEKKFKRIFLLYCLHALYDDAFGVTNVSAENNLFGLNSLLNTSTHTKHQLNKNGREKAQWTNRRCEKQWKMKQCAKYILKWIECW